MNIAFGYIFKNGVDKNRNSNQTQDNGVNKDAQLEIQNLFAVVIHKFRFVFLGTPNYNREDVISKGDNILCQST